MPTIHITGDWHIHSPEFCEVRRMEDGWVLVSFASMKVGFTMYETESVSPLEAFSQLSGLPFGGGELEPGFTFETGIGD